MTPCFLTLLHSSQQFPVANGLQHLLSFFFGHRPSVRICGRIAVAELLRTGCLSTSRLLLLRLFRRVVLRFLFVQWLVVFLVVG